MHNYFSWCGTSSLRTSLCTARECHCVWSHEKVSSWTFKHLQRRPMNVRFEERAHTRDMNVFMTVTVYVLMNGCHYGCRRTTPISTHDHIGSLKHNTDELISRKCSLYSEHRNNTERSNHQYRFSLSK